MIIAGTSTVAVSLLGHMHMLLRCRCVRHGLPYCVRGGKDESGAIEPSDHASDRQRPGHIIAQMWILGVQIHLQGVCRVSVSVCMCVCVARGAIGNGLRADALPACSVFALARCGLRGVACTLPLSFVCI